MRMPTHAQLASYGLKGYEFYDLLMWTTKGAARFGDGWLRRVRVANPWGVLSWAQSVERQNA